MVYNRCIIIHKCYTETFFQYKTTCEVLNRIESSLVYCKYISEKQRHPLTPLWNITDPHHSYNLQRQTKKTKRELIKKSQTQKLSYICYSLPSFFFVVSLNFLFHLERKQPTNHEVAKFGFPWNTLEVTNRLSVSEDVHFFRSFKGTCFPWDNEMV